MTYIGIDDTDTLDTQGTNQLARVLVKPNPKTYWPPLSSHTFTRGCHRTRGPERRAADAMSNSRINGGCAISASARHERITTPAAAGKAPGVAPFR
jgi:hypothetical protein